MKQYLLNIWIAISTMFWVVLKQLDFVLNALTGGDPQEYISSRAGKYAARSRGWFPCQLCKFLNLFDKNHCQDSIQKSQGNDSIIWSEDI